MNKRSFLKKLGILMGGAIIAPQLLASEENKLNKSFKFIPYRDNIEDTYLPLIEKPFIKMPMPAVMVQTPFEQKIVMAKTQILKTRISEVDFQNNNLEETYLKIKQELLDNKYTHLYMIMTTSRMRNMDTSEEFRGIMVRGCALDDYYPIINDRANLVFYIDKNIEENVENISLKVESIPIDSKYKHLFENKIWKTGSSLPYKNELQQFFIDNNIPWN